MDQATYDRWGSLHLRAAKGEPLTSEEQAAYEAGLKQIRESEKLKIDPMILSQLRAEKAAREAELKRLWEKRAPLEAEIARLEALLCDRASELPRARD